MKPNLKITMLPVIIAAFLYSSCSISEYIDKMNKHDIMSRLRSSNWQNRTLALDELSRYPFDDWAKDILDIGFKDINPTVRMKAVKIMFSSREPDYIYYKSAIMLNKETEPSIIIFILHEIDIYNSTFMTNYAYRREIEELLENNNDSVRAQAITTIGIYSDYFEPYIMTELIDALYDPSDRVIEQAIWALSRYGNSALESEEVLKQKLKSRNPDIRRIAISTLVQISQGMNILDSIMPLVSDTDNSVRAAAFEAIGDIGIRKEEIYKSMEVAFQSKDKYLDISVAYCAIRLRYKGTEAINYMINMLEDKDYRVRIYILNLLMDLRGDAEPALGKLSDIINNDGYVDAVGQYYIRELASIAYDAILAGAD